MINLVDPVQRHIYAITVRDSIVPDDASDLQLPAVVSAKQVARLQRAMLPGVDFAGTDDIAPLEDPRGRRVGRVAFAKPLQALWIDGSWTGAGPAPYRLPNDAGTIADFIRRQTRLTDGTTEGDTRVAHLIGFSICDHARVTDTLRSGGAGASLFVAASMLSAACVKYERTHQRTAETGRGKPDADQAAAEVEAALIGAARIATETALSNSPAPPGILRIARHLVDQVEAVRRNRPRGRATGAVRIAASAADAVHRWLTRGILHDLPLNHDREAARLPLRLATRNESMAAMVDAVIADIAAVDTSALYVLLMARRLDVALGRNRWLAAPHPVFRLTYGFIGGHALFAEVERLGAIVAAMADRAMQPDGVSLNSKSLRSALSAPSEMQSTIVAQDAAGRYLDLGAYHRAVTNGFIQDRARWMATTASSYPHHAYALGLRRCNLAAAAAHASTHDFIRRTELDKPTQQGNRQQPLVLFYGLDSQETVILGLRQILDRIIMRGAGTNDWRSAFARTVLSILKATAPLAAKRLEISSALKIDAATGKGLFNRAASLASRFDDRDYDRPAGPRFDYALWFHRDRDIAFWDRMQKGVKLYEAFGTAFIPAPIQDQTIPKRQGRRATAPDAPSSRWQQIMVAAKTAFDAYRPLYVKSRPSALTARIMARMSEGYSALASDPSFRTIFK